MRRTGTVLVALLVGFSFAACGGDEPVAASGTNAASARDVTPALWKLADSATTIYLFGTFHALPAGT